MDPQEIALADGKENEHPNLTQIAAEVARAGVSPAQGISANCSTRYRATKHSGNRPLSQIKWVVMHCTEGATAAGAASWFANPRSQGSAHLCVDNLICYRTLEDRQVPWGAQGANYKGYHIELAGYARWTSVMWSVAHRKTLERGAYKAALRCRWYGIPPYFVSAPDLRRGKAGVTTHNECSKAFGGSHWDPGFGWPRMYFMNRLRHHYRLLWHEAQRA